MTVYESLIECPNCHAQLVVPRTTAAGVAELPKHMLGGQSSSTGRDGWICERSGDMLPILARRQYESPDA